MDDGEVFVPFDGPGMDGDPVDRASLEALMVAGRVSFGRMPVTVAIGSGEMFRFGVER
jgi:hypothetical protein